MATSRCWAAWRARFSPYFQVDPSRTQPHNIGSDEAQATDSEDPRTCTAGLLGTRVHLSSSGPRFTSFRQEVSPSNKVPVHSNTLRPCPEGDDCISCYEALDVFFSRPVATRFQAASCLALSTGDYLQRATDIQLRGPAIAHLRPNRDYWPACSAPLPSCLLGTLLALKRSKNCDLYYTGVARPSAKPTVLR